MKFGGSSQLMEKMQAALDRFFNVFRCDRFRRIVTDPARSPQKDHRGRNPLGQNHGIVTSAAHHPVGLASGLDYGLFDFGDPSRIHRDRALVQQHTVADR